MMADMGGQARNEVAGTLARVIATRLRRYRTSPVPQQTVTAALGEDPALRGTPETRWRMTETII
jgi:hypothetical protein